jgi:hypothetical protein
VEELALGRILFEYFDLPLQFSFHYCSALIMVCHLVLVR